MTALEVGSNPNLSLENNMWKINMEIGNAFETLKKRKELKQEVEWNFHISFSILFPSSEGIANNVDGNLRYQIISS